MHCPASIPARRIAAALAASAVVVAGLLVAPAAVAGPASEAVGPAVLVEPGAAPSHSASARDGAAGDAAAALAAPPHLVQVRAVFDGINAYRASRGLPPMRYSADISAVAQEWSDLMAAEDRFEHSDDFHELMPTGWTDAGEIIAYRGDARGQGLVEQWIASPPHRELLLHPFTTMGVGVRIVQVDGATRMYGTVNLGTYPTGPTDAAIDVDAWMTAAGIPGALPTVRIAGADRYAAAVSMSREHNAPGAIDTVYVVSGETFPDALSAAPVAAQLGHALLLTAGRSVPAVVEGELVRLDPERVVVVGGTSTIAMEVEAEIAGLLPTADVRRAWGLDRWDMSVVLAEAGFPQADRAYVTSGEVFTDALSAAPVAAVDGAPVLLTAGRAVPAALVAHLEEAGYAEIAVVGGPASVSDAVLERIRLASGAEVRRIAGDSRWSTNLLVAREAASRAPGVLLTSGEKFPDALAGAAIAPRVGPLLLTPSTCVPRDALGLIRAHGAPASSTFVLGGTATLTQSVARLSPCGF